MTDQTQAGPKRLETMRAALDVSGPVPSPKLRTLVCPYCGGVTPDASACASCSAPLDVLSRQATQNQMGPWFLRDNENGHRPGCSYSTIERMAKVGTITPTSVVRGPSTHQFWMLAKHAPGIAHLLGVCHNCSKPTSPDDFACKGCGEPFSVQRDRQHLGLGPSRPLPGSARIELVAMHAGGVEGAERVEGPSVSLGVNKTVTTNQDTSAAALGAAGSAQASTRVRELERSTELLKKAWANERRRSWISFWCAVVVSLLALVMFWMS